MLKYAKLISSSSVNNSTTEETKKQIMGDVDLDGQLSVMDAVFIQNVLLGKVKATSEQKACADYDRDNSITILDSLEIQLHLLKK